MKHIIKIACLVLIFCSFPSHAADDITPEDRTSEKYTEGYNAFYIVDSCYEARKGRMIQYVDRNQRDAAKQRFNQWDSTVQLSEAAKKKIRNKVASDMANWRYMLTAAQHNDEDADICALGQLGMMVLQ